MPKICYDRACRDRLLASRRMDLVNKAITIIEEYEAEGFDLTLRQLYYQFVARGFLENKDTEYKRLGATIQDARYAGLIDWESIIDRTRYLRDLAHWDAPSDIIEACASQFRVDKWATQQYRVEVWVEKDAAIGTVDAICKQLDVPYFSCRGYTSASEVWVAAQRLIKHVENDQIPVILHFGDHDPSGVDMTRDIRERLQTFMRGRIDLRRLALNMDQVQEYNPPPNPAKLTDARATGYIAQYGRESWELDALEPRIVRGLIQTAVTNLRETDAWTAKEEEETRARDQLTKVAGRWSEVVDLVRRVKP